MSKLCNENGDLGFKHLFFANCLKVELIHEANPMIIVFAHVVRSSPLFKTKRISSEETMFATGKTIGLAEWIIDDTCLVSLVLGEDEKVGRP